MTTEASAEAESGHATPSCTNHCRTCNRHFHSVAAFDAHRVFADPEVEDWTQRICLDPDHDVERLTRTDGNLRLVAYTRAGICRLQAAEPKQPVVIWQEYDPRGDERFPR